MVSRDDCDRLYQSIGFPKYDASIPYQEVIGASTARGLTVFKQQQLQRCAAMALKCDVEEYFEISEHATTEEGIAAIDSPATANAIYLIRASGSTQRPLELRVIPLGGYCFKKCIVDPKYVIYSFDDVRRDADIWFDVVPMISNLPESVVENVLRSAEGIVIIPRELPGADEEPAFDASTDPSDDHPASSWLGYFSALAEHCLVQLGVVPAHLL